MRKLSKTMEAAIRTLAPFSQGRGRGGVSAKKAKTLGVTQTTLSALVKRGFARTREDFRGGFWSPTTTHYKLTKDGLALA